MRPRTNNFLEQLKAKRDAAKQAEVAVTAPPAPAPVPASEFSDPAVALEDARDQLGNVRRELETERERRRAAESRASRLEAAPMSRGTLFSSLNRRTRRPPWR